MLSKLAKRRITKLIQYMRSLPKNAGKHFNMSRWAYHTGEGAHWARGDVLTRDNLTSCGTTACAAGWAASMPYFRRLGLRLDAVNDRLGIINSLDVFDIDAFREIELFGPHNKDKTPKAWAARAEKLIKKWENE